MPRRIVTLMLALLLAHTLAPAAWTAAPASNISRFDFGRSSDGDLTIRANECWDWQEQSERVVGLSNKIVVSLGKDYYFADRSVIWIDREGPKLPGLVRGTIYAEGNVQFVIDGKAQSAPAVLLQFSTRGAVILPPNQKLQTTPLRDSPFYRQALQARQAPAGPELAAPNPKLPAAGTAPPPLPPGIAAASASTAPPGRVGGGGVAETNIQTPASGNGVVTADATGGGPGAGGFILPVQSTPPAVGPQPPPPDPVPGAKGGPVFIEPPVFETPAIPLPNVNTRKLKIANRSSNPTNVKLLNMPSGEQVAIITGGVKVLVTIPQSVGEQIVDIEADQVVVWQRGDKQNGPGDLANAMREGDGAAQTPDKETELYLTGYVIMRFGSTTEARNPDGSPVEDKVLYAEQAYYDVTHNKALALDADLQMMRPGVKQPARVKTPELEMLSPEEFLMEKAEISASALLTDPGLDLWIRKVKITEEKNVVKRTIFGFPYVDRFTGEEDIGVYRRFEATNSLVEVAGVPIGYFPYYAGDVEHPFGPLQNLGFQQSTIFGMAFYTTWSMLDLLGIKKLPGENWSLFLDYMSNRGPGFGSSYDLMGDRLFGFDAPFQTHIVGYAVYDKGMDNLGGPRETEFVPTAWRDRFLFRHQQTYEDWTFQGQFSYLSDHNFLEAYYNYEFNYGPNQETFVYPKYQVGNGAATLLAEPNVNRPWVTESQWLPRVDGQWLGQSFFDMFTYNTWGSAGYSQLQTYNLPANQLPPGPPTTIVTFPANPSEVPINAARLDWMQQLSMPFSLGFLRLAPYANLDLAYYSQDYVANNVGRVYGGGGVRANVPLSRLYEDIESEFFNIHGIFHKMTFKANYYNAGTNVDPSVLPQLDRLNDDATQQAWRDVTPWQPVYRPGITGNALYTLPLYDPRIYALRRLLDTKVDNLGTMQVVQAEIDQRWQTKRGYPGMEHTIDYFTFDMSASFYPAPNRDDFGHPVSFVEYYSTWAAGDRNGFTSSGWFDPWAFGTKYWNLMGYYNRADGTNFSLSYRQFDPIGSKLVSGSIAYNFSPKYAIAYSASFDLAITTNQSQSLMVTRTGTDLTWMLGFTYNAILNNFGLNFMVLPNLIAQRGGLSANSGFSSTGQGQNTMTNGRQ